MRRRAGAVLIRFTEETSTFKATCGWSQMLTTQPSFVGAIHLCLFLRIIRSEQRNHDRLGYALALRIRRLPVGLRASWRDIDVLERIVWRDRSGLSANGRRIHRDEL